MSDLYGPGDKVIRLSDRDFDVQEGKAKLRRFSGSGIIKAYAPWCPHCVSKKEDVKILGEVLNDEHPEWGMRMYTFNADGPNPNISKAVHINGEPLIAGFPTMLYVDDNGEVGRLLGRDGQPVHTISDMLDALCASKNKLCRENDGLRRRLH